VSFTASTLLLLIVVDVFLDKPVSTVHAAPSQSAVIVSASRVSELARAASLPSDSKPAARRYGKNSSIVRTQMTGAAHLQQAAPLVLPTAADVSSEWDCVLSDAANSSTDKRVEGLRRSNSRSDGDTVVSHESTVPYPRIIGSSSSNSSGSDNEDSVSCSPRNSCSREDVAPERAQSNQPKASLVLNTLPPVRTLLYVAVDVASGSVRVLQLNRCAPALQPAFDSGRKARAGVGGSGVLAAVTTGLVTEVRRSFLPALAGARQGLQLTRELNNDAVLCGRPLQALIHPEYPIALVA